MRKDHHTWTAYFEPGNPPGRLRDRLFILHVILLVILATVWLASLGPVPGIVAVLIAKHILVALLMSRIERTEDSDL